MSIHMLSNNLLAPQLVGKRCALNALSITIALLFWGMDLGRNGIAAGDSADGGAARVICGHTES